MCCHPTVKCNKCLYALGSAPVESCQKPSPKCITTYRDIFPRICDNCIQQEADKIEKLKRSPKKK
ncbi:uncharacterized protein RSE6_04585 [Rhynchosporium secalis]|uniref:Uncharacterized protein n=1 Tax=Rhynchosporium secalis TaxID=38038 RepID=A0A1E1M5P1_RHYSE|nr:uncharacterized protein RSE6_04585 [Rhynchosporium secalis]